MERIKYWKEKTGLEAHPTSVWSYSLPLNIIYLFIELIYLRKKIVEYILSSISMCMDLEMGLF